jgi:hypothetical protein
MSVSVVAGRPLRYFALGVLTTRHGGALDGREGEAGALMLQGDHTAVRYYNIVLTLASYARIPGGI